jgi:hypothetical protein
METCAHLIRGVPKLDRIRTSFCVAAAAATPTIKLASRRCHRWPNHRGSQRADAVDEVVLRTQAQTTHPSSRLSDQIRPSDQGGAEDTDATVTEAVPVAAESATEATEQENDEDDNEDGSERQRPDLRGAIKFRTMPRRI